MNVSSPWEGLILLSLISSLGVMVTAAYLPKPPPPYFAFSSSTTNNFPLSLCQQPTPLSLSLITILPGDRRTILHPKWHPIRLYGALLLTRSLWTLVKSCALCRNWISFETQTKTTFSNQSRSLSLFFGFLFNWNNTTCKWCCRSIRPKSIDNRPQGNVGFHGGVFHPLMRRAEKISIVYSWRPVSPRLLLKTFCRRRSDGKDQWVLTRRRRERTQGVYNQDITLCHSRSHRYGVQSSPALFLMFGEQCNSSPNFSYLSFLHLWLFEFFGFIRVLPLGINITIKCIYCSISHPQDTFNTSWHPQETVTHLVLLQSC